MSLPAGNLLDLSESDRDALIQQLTAMQKIQQSTANTRAEKSSRASPANSHSSVQANAASSDYDSNEDEDAVGANNRKRTKFNHSEQTENDTTDEENLTEKENDNDSTENLRMHPNLFHINNGRQKKAQQQSQAAAAVSSAQRIQNSSNRSTVRQFDQADHHGLQGRNTTAIPTASTTANRSEVWIYNRQNSRNYAKAYADGSLEMNGMSESEFLHKIRPASSSAKLATANGNSHCFLCVNAYISVY